MADPRIDQWAQKLLILAEGSSRVQDLAIGREEARIIGEEINTAGGFDLMREVARRTRDLGRKQPFALGYVERWWNGIGGWRS
jgi:hypothetical protein